MLKLGDYVILLGGSFESAYRDNRATEGHITSIYGDWYRIAGETDGWHEQFMELTEPEYELACKVLGEDYFA